MNVAWGAVFHHLWQSSLFAAVAWLLAGALHCHGGRIRYRIWLAASLKFLLPFSLLVGLGGRIGPLPVAAPVKAIAQPVRGVSAFVQPLDLTLGTPGPRRDTVTILLAAIWLCGFLAVRGRYYARSRQARAALRDAQFPAAGREVELLRELDRRVRLALSRRWMEPAVFGVFRPVVVLPAGIAAKLDDAQLRAILAHELCHVRRRDNLAAAAHMIVEAVFWFHPLVWWLGARLVEDREHACDEEVLRMGSEPAAYARSILRVCEYCLESPLASVSGVTGADLKKRIEQIAANRIVRDLGLGRRLLLAAAGGAAIVLPLAIGWAQSQSFEVASIKPTHYGGGPLRVTGAVEPDGINFKNVTLRNCIQRAYGVKPYQVTGPAWIGTERYTIVAKASGAAKEEQLMLMLQTLLAERFKLQFHRESKEMPVYALVVAKNGPKLKESKGEGATEIGGYTPEGSDAHGISAEHTSMSLLAGALRRWVDLPVVDQTGLSGVYDFKLTWSEKDTSDAPSIFTALQEQLGLKLESKRAPVEIIAVDRAEKAPIEN